MNEQFQVAQASVPGNSNGSATPRIFKLTKPLTDQAVTINLGYDQKTQLDFTAIANEKITLVMATHDRSLAEEIHFRSRLQARIHLYGNGKLYR